MLVILDVNKKMMSLRRVRGSRLGWVGKNDIKCGQTNNTGMQPDQKK